MQSCKVFDISMEIFLSCVICLICTTVHNKIIPKIRDVAEAVIANVAPKTYLIVAVKLHCSRNTNKPDSEPSRYTDGYYGNAKPDVIFLEKFVLSASKGWRERVTLSHTRRYHVTTAGDTSDRW